MRIIKKTVQYILLIFVACFSIGIKAQENEITVTGKLDASNRVIHISDELKRTLFVRSKGHLYMPDLGYFLTLTDEEAKKHQNESLLIIPLDGKFYGAENKKITVKANQLIPENDQIFFFKKDIKSKIEKSFFENTSLIDTVEWQSVTNYKKLTYTKQWIDNLENTQEVVVKYNVLCGEPISDQDDYPCEEEYSFEKKSMDFLARQQLHYVAILFDEIKEDSWGKKEWIAWFNAISTHEFERTRECNPKNWMKPIKYPNSSYYSSLFDSQENQIIRIETSPNQDFALEQQVLVFDLKRKKSVVRKIKTTSAVNFKAFEAIQRKLFVLTNRLRWQSYFFDEEGVYTLQKEVKIFPENKKNNNLKIHQTYTNNNIMYMVFEEEKSKDFYIASIITKTGEVTLKNLKKVLGDSSFKFKKNNLKIIHLKYGNKDENDFITAFKIGKKKYILKVDQILNKKAITETTKEIEYSNTVITNTNSIRFIKQDYDDGKSYINIISYDRDLKNYQHKIIKRKQEYYGNPSLITKAENGFLIVSGATSHFRFKIKSSLYNNFYSIVKEDCIFSYLPVEEINSETIAKLFYIKKLENEWYTFFKSSGNGLRFSKI